MTTLLCWVGLTDIRAAQGDGQAGDGPIGQVLKGGDFSDALLLMDKRTAKDRAGVEAFLNGLSSGGTRLVFKPTDLDNPTDFRAIYAIANEALTALLQDDPDGEVTLHLSPGTPAMAAVWILLAAKSGRAVRLVQSSRERGVEEVNLPFDIHAEYVEDLVRGQSRRVMAAAEPHIPQPGFEDIQYKSGLMARAVERARKVAVHDVPVLIQGESGTGKEMFAKAIHKASRRAGAVMVSVNCGAFPPALLESMLFGYVKGAFTDAKKDSAGFFEQADGGTLFLDEIGELPLEAQSRLLRVLQEGQVRRLGAEEDKKVDVRIISATNRDLKDEVRLGKFREDLYYRLSITTLQLPPLRERRGDLTLLTDELLSAICSRLGADKSLLPSARNVIANHTWPGNVRELQASLTRAVIWSEGERITETDMSEAIDSPIGGSGDTVLARELGDGFSLDDLLSYVKKHYVIRALERSHGNQTKAAELLGYRQQTLSAYIKKHLPT